MYTIASLGRKVQGGRDAGTQRAMGSTKEVVLAHFTVRSQNRLLTGDGVISELGFEACVGVIVAIRESALLVDQE